MTFKIIYDEKGHPVKAEVWAEIKQPLLSNNNLYSGGFRNNSVGLVIADDKEDALSKAKHLPHLIMC